MKDLPDTRVQADEPLQFFFELSTEDAFFPLEYLKECDSPLDEMKVQDTTYDRRIQAP